MATGLATRCSACGTVFRVVPDQLRVSEGWVRCGRCSQVFNALEGLVDLETGLPRRTGSGLAPPVHEESTEAEFDIAQPAAKPGRPPLSIPPAPPVPPAAPAAAAAQWPAPAKATKRTPAAPPTSPALPENAAPHAQAALDIDVDIPTRPTSESDPDRDPTRDEGPQSVLESGWLAPAEKPSFVRNAERAARWRHPGVRALLVVLSVLAALTLLAQVGHEYRDLLAARLPETRPWLDKACQPLGCKVEAARAIESLAVESSGLVRVERSSLYRLQVSLRNRSGIDLAVPALDVTLTDTQGRLVSRKVMQLAELGAPQATIAAGRELSVQATLQATAGGEAGAQPIAGYTIDLFYP